MFGIGTTELLIVMAVALMVLGPKKLPTIARTLGKAMGEFKRVSTDFQRTINVEIEREDLEKKKKAEEARRLARQEEEAKDRTEPDAVPAETDDAKAPAGTAAKDAAPAAENTKEGTDA